MAARAMGANRVFPGHMHPDNAFEGSIYPKVVTWGGLPGSDNPDFPRRLSLRGCQWRLRGNVDRYESNIQDVAMRYGDPGLKNRRPVKILEVANTRGASSWRQCAPEKSS